MINQAWSLSLIKRYAQSHIRSTWNQQVNHLSVRAFASTSMPPPPPVIERYSAASGHSSSTNVMNDVQAKRLNRVYFLTIAIFGFLLLDYIQSTVAAGASLYSAEEMRMLHKHILSGGNNSNTSSNNDALRADIIQFMETHNRQYDTLQKDITDLRSQLDGRPVIKPHEHPNTWRSSVENLLSDVSKPPKRE